MPAFPRDGLPRTRRGGNRSAPVTGPQYGGAPGWTGPSVGIPAPPPPSPATQPMGGQAGAVMTNAARPGAPQVPFRTRFFPPFKWPNAAYGSRGDESRIMRDRHAYLSTGYLRSGHQPSVPGNPPNPDNQYPARATYRMVNVTINPQQGSDNTRNQDDLSRPYTWHGQQDGSITRVNGGVPGLWTEYGNRGLPQGIHDPTDGQGGPEFINPGPPHGLHSMTMPAGQQPLARFRATPQMAPVRQDRPSNSVIAGQSFSQTVVPQGGGGQPPRSPSFRASASLRAGTGRRGRAG